MYNVFGYPILAQQKSLGMEGCNPAIAMEGSFNTITEWKEAKQSKKDTNIKHSNAGGQDIHKW